ncbi:MAG: PSD1 and planctomycete cytochrome C domain-containing protein [Planctomycetia bacterium]|nr:PSD1 and planctomycete cytochrome C domain-containing protein [Planctomycetia bacterium]
MNAFATGLTLLTRRSARARGLVRQSATLICVAIASHASFAAAAAPALRFDRDIRPILSENCFACHGPGKQEAGLRLDSAADATRELDSGSRAIVPGDFGASELAARLEATDADVVMPPPHTNKILKPEEKDLLKRWIAAGAHYEKHWAFQPIVKPEAPAVTDPAATSPIDRFLESRLAMEGMAVNAEADRPTLIRRVTFALTGLPPTTAEVDAFLADNTPDAYERLVDSLLTSPQHGEEMARHWLDVARYADTHGLHLDNERQMWAYRDWVVKAFNDNLPFDRFTIEQLAGDLLPAATRDQKVATGFSRCNVTTSEGGSINDELLFRYAVDRTATVTNAWMGLTGQCAVCHDHKFDPISAREFYSLYAFFNSAADPGFDGNKLLTAPTLKLPSGEQESRLAALDARLPELKATLDEVVGGLAYVDPVTLDPKPEPVRAETVWLDDEFPPAAAVRSGPGGPLDWFTSTVPGEVLSGHRSLERTATGIGQDFYESGAEPIVIPAKSEIFANVWLDPAAPPKALMLQFHTGGWKHRAVWGDPAVIGWGQLGTESLVAMGPLPEAGKWGRLSVTADKLGLADGAKVTGFALTQFDGHVRWDLVGLSTIDDPTANPTKSLSAWWQERTGKDKLDDVPKPLQAIVRQGQEKTTKPNEIDLVQRHWLTKVWSEQPDRLVLAARALDDAQKERDQVDAAIVQTFVFNDLPAMRDSFVMLRGAYDKPGEKVERSTPAFLPSLPIVEGIPLTRLDLAKWLVSPEHPLTARVTANRLWQQFFGLGLVKTSDDFGSQGEPPSHPELLDWLAAEYRESGWNTRALVKRIVTSRAFRRSGVVEPAHLAQDPENRLLARGPRIRLDAEQIRDQSLALSGLLVVAMGGKGVKPYQPDNIWEPVGFAGSDTRNYKRDSGTALYRRSLYTFLKRTAPPPFMVNFDAPNREQFCARRERSNTPLQALQLMNDTQHIEAARALAARMLAEAAGDDASRIEWLVRTVLARRPEPEEAAVVMETLATHRVRYAADAESAKKLIAHGETKPPESADPGELAAWTLVANMLLNLDETLTRN